MKKKCSKCKETKLTSEFSKNRKKYDGFQSTCKICSRLASKAHYKKNKKYYEQKRDRWKKDFKLWWKNYKSRFSCSQCGEDHPACIQFHHVDPSNKAYNIADIIAQSMSKEKLFEELEKCIPLCANCHAKHHWNE